MKVLNGPKNQVTGSKPGNADPLLNNDNVKRTKSQDAKSAFEGATKVDISTRAADINKAKALATPSDTINEEKVARLQKMIDQGSYKVDADAIADRMVDEQFKMQS